MRTAFGHLKILLSNMVSFMFSRVARGPDWNFLPSFWRNVYTDRSPELRSCGPGWELSSCPIGEPLWKS